MTADEADAEVDLVNAARAMLAALKQAQAYVEAVAEQDRENDVESSETQAERDLIDIRAAIAQAEAAGIK